MSHILARVSVALGAIVLIFAFTLSTSAATCPPIVRTLARGATGADVTALQQFLISQGVLSADSATGYFGPLTEKGVQSIQKTRNVVTSGTAASTGFGLVGKRTQAAIAALCTGSVSQSTVKAHVVPILKNRNCPQVPLPIGKSCTNTWREVKDTKGCTASWQCTK